LYHWIQCIATLCWISVHILSIFNLHERLIISHLQLVCIILSFLPFLLFVFFTPDFLALILPSSLAFKIWLDPHLLPTMNLMCNEFYSFLGSFWYLLIKPTYTQGGLDSGSHQTEFIYLPPNTHTHTHTHTNPWNIQVKHAMQEVTRVAATWQVWKLGRNWRLFVITTRKAGQWVATLRWKRWKEGISSAPPLPWTIALGLHWRPRPRCPWE